MVDPWRLVAESRCFGDNAVVLIQARQAASTPNIHARQIGWDSSILAGAVGTAGVE